MTYIEECLKKYAKLPEVIKSAATESSLIARLGELERESQAPLSFVLVLFLIGELKLEEIADYLELKYDLEPDEADKFADLLESDILSTIAERVGDLPTDEADDLANVDLTNLDLVKRKEILNDTFANLVGVLKEDSEYGDLNLMLIQTFQGDDTFEDELVDKLYNNQELLTNKFLLVDGKETAGTIANWLKDFIKENGSDYFDSLVLSKYLSLSLNPKTLPEYEKNLVKKLLKLYRNLVFFDESTNGLPMSAWEIFPNDEATTLEPELETSPAESDFIVKDEPKKEEPKIEVPAPIDVPAPAEISPADELQTLLKQYQPDSLEYKAISEELKRIYRN